MIMIYYHDSGWGIMYMPIILFKKQIYSSNLPIYTLDHILGTDKNIIHLICLLGFRITF